MSSSWNKPCIAMVSTVASSFTKTQNLADDHPIKFMNSYLRKGNNTLVQFAFMRSNQWLQRESILKTVRVPIWSIQRLQNWYLWLNVSE